jgi:predicted Zn-dependent protease
MDTLTTAPRRRHARPGRAALTALVSVVVVGFSLGRFLLFEPGSGVESSTPRLGLSAPAQLARLESAVRRDPADVRSLQQLAGLAVQRAAQTADPSYYDLAQRALDRADAVAPGHHVTVITRGLLALSLHDFSEAFELGERVHASHPANPDALAVLVDASVELGRYEAAEAYLQELLDRRPGVPAYSRVSYLRELHGDDAGALVAMREALVASGGSSFDDATIQTFLGDLAFARGDVVEADLAYGRALRTDPKLPLAALGRARTLAAAGRRTEAIGALEQLTRRVPLPAAVTLLGDLQAGEGRAVDAAHSYELVRTISRLQAASGQVTDLELAVFEADEGSGAAVDRARAAYAARPDNVYAADALAWALVRAGDAEQARPLVDRALRLGTNDALLRYHAAVVLDANGETAAAAAQLATALARNPWFSFRHRADAASLATRLGVVVPSAWERS